MQGKRIGYSVVDAGWPVGREEGGQRALQCVGSFLGHKPGDGWVESLR